jgi:type III restriction enzyme
MDLRRIAAEWLKTYFHPVGGVQQAQILAPRFLENASQRITAAITRAMIGETGVVAILDPFNPEGSSRHVNYNTTQADLYQTSAGRSHINYVVLDSTWEAQFCRVAEQHPRVHCYIKNSANLGFQVPYLFNSANRYYEPDFILRIDDGHGKDDPLNLIVEIKGFRREDAKVKRETMETRWVPGVNRSGQHGRWAFAEYSSIYTLESEFERLIESYLNQVIEQAVSGNLFPVVGDVSRIN